MSKIDMTKVHGKYAAQRVEFLENHSLDMLEAMINDGSIYEHLNFVQSMVSEYVDRSVEKSKQSDEYKKAESACDLAEMSRLIATSEANAEMEAGTEWIYILPDNEEIEQDDEKDFEDMSFGEAVQDIYNDINKLKTAVSNLDSDENGTEDVE